MGKTQRGYSRNSRSCKYFSTHGKDLHCISTDESIPKNELGFWDKKVYEETYEDLENLSNLLTDVGVKVYRPTPIDTTQTISNGHWETTQYYTFVQEIL